MVGVRDDGVCLYWTSQGPMSFLGVIEHLRMHGADDISIESSALIALQEIAPEDYSVWRDHWDTKLREEQP